jgi:asparagine synthase (glutamine-hydrolysing)
MRHRGPDGEGYYLDEMRQIGFGHRRLKIIDLSDAAAQPMANEDDTVWLTFNGEIYNYLELVPLLEERGHRFRSHSDTEVILHAYEEWGIECLAHFNGMFAFALWDETRRRLFCARDRLGIKPFYYHFEESEFIGNL